jgi:hypothetical protein
VRSGLLLLLLLLWFSLHCFFFLRFGVLLPPSLV